MQIFSVFFVSPIFLGATEIFSFLSFLSANKAVIRYVLFLNAVLEAISNAPFADIRGLQNAELCYPMQQNMSVIVTNEQVRFNMFGYKLSSIIFFYANQEA